MSGLAERNGGRAGIAALAMVLLLGLGLRLGEAWDGRAPVYDAAAYATIAANLDRGDGFTLGAEATQPASNYSPGLPLFVASIYKLTGGVHQRTARVVLALIGALSILFTYLIGRHLSGTAAGLIGAAAVAVYPALLEYQGMLMGEPLAATLLAGAVLATLWAAAVNGSAPRGGWRGFGGPSEDAAQPRPQDGGSKSVTGPAAPEPSEPRHHAVRWLLPGALFGTLVLVRPEYLVIAVLVSLVVLARSWRDKRRDGAIQVAVLLVAAAVIVVPWTVRNATALHRFVPVSTGGGQVLFAGTYLPSGGDPERVGGEVVKRHPELFGAHAVERLRLEQILARLAKQRYPGIETDKALSRMGKEQLWDDASEEPLEYAGFVAKKVARIWSHGPRDVMREPGWEVFHWLLVGLGLVGLVVLAKQRRWEALLLATIFLAITAVSALLVASPRRVLVMMPLVASLAGVGIVWLVEWSARRRAVT